MPQERRYHDTWKGSNHDSRIRINHSLRSIPAKTNEGTISYSAVFNASVDSSNYNVPVTTVINYGAITNIIDVLTQG
jgi:hypothetical protein